MADVQESTSAQSVAGDTVRDHTQGTDQKAGQDTQSEVPRADIHNEDDNQATQTVQEEAVEADSTTEKKIANDQEKPASDTTVPSALLKTTRRAEDNYKKNNKFDASVLPESDDANEIRRQIEFYLSTSNLDSGDKYMLELCGGTENKPISIETLANFKRMRRFRPLSVIVDALRSSNELDVVGVPGQEMVKRKVPWEQSEQSRVDARSIYAKGFGDEQPATQFEIEAFFEPYGPIVSVRLRRTFHKLFKGSVFVEFKDDEVYKKFLALEPKPMWQEKHELLIRPKTEYVKEKNESIINGDTELGRGNRSGNRGRGNGQRGRGRGRGRSNGDRDPTDWKKRRQDDQANGFKDRRGTNKSSRGRGRGGGDRNDLSRSDATTESNDIPESTASKIENAVSASTAAESQRPTQDSAAPDVTTQKRGREDDTGTEEQPSKKVDMKAEVTAGP